MVESIDVLSKNNAISEPQPHTEKNHSLPTQSFSSQPSPPIANQNPLSLNAANSEPPLRLSNSQSKLFVLDTNVLLHDPNALLAFNEHHVVIPMTVLEELDAIKDRRDKDVSREARIAINAIDGIVRDASPEQLQSGAVGR